MITYSHLWLVHSDHYEGSNADPEFIARVGMFCVAYYAEDGHWYRAKVQQVMPGELLIYYGPKLTRSACITTTLPLHPSCNYTTLQKYTYMHSFMPI